MVKLLLFNTGSNASLLVVNIVFSFIMAPVIVKALGNYDYGIWEIVISLLGYMGLLDLGIRPAVTRYVAKYSAIKDNTALNQLLNTVFAFSGCVGILACCILVLYTVIEPRMLAEHGSVGKDSKYIYFTLIIAVQLLIQFPGYIAECFHLGHQRYYLTNNITIFNIIVGNSILYYMLGHGYGLLSLALINCMGLSLKYCVYFILLHFKKYGNYRLKKNGFSWSMLKTMITFGGKSMLAGAAGTISGGLPAIVIGSFLGASAVPFYTIPAKLINYIKDFTMTVANVFMPMFSHLQSLNEKENLKLVYLQATKYIAALVFPMTLGAIIIGPYFIQVWIGPSYANHSQMIFYFLGVSTLLYASNPLFHRLMTGIDRLNILIFTRVLIVAIQGILMLAMVRSFGNNGIAFAMMVSFFCIIPIELWATLKNIEVTLKEFVKKIYLPLFFPNIILYALVHYMVLKIEPFSYIKMGYIVTCAAFVYFILVYLISLTKEEKQYLNSKLKKAIA